LKARSRILGSHECEITKQQWSTSHCSDENPKTETARSPAAETGINPKLAGSEDRRGGVMWVKI
jgi:hypothetical protein